MLEVECRFDAAHKLTSHKGKCGRLHGHTYRVLVRVRGQTDKNTNMEVDFADLKKIIMGKLPDHEYLNDFYSEPNPTAEFVAKYLHAQLIPDLPWGVKLLTVTVFEGDFSSATHGDY